MLCIIPVVGIRFIVMSYFESGLSIDHLDHTINGDFPPVYTRKSVSNLYTLYSAEITLCMAVPSK